MIKNTLVFVGLIVGFTSVFAQLPKCMNVKRFDWNQYEVQFKPHYKSEEILALKNEPIFKQILASKFWSPSDFHFIDYDGDGLLDLVYQGFVPGDDCDHVIFLKAHCEDYCGYMRVEEDFAGEVVDLKLEHRDAAIEFTLLERPGCAGVTFQIETYRVNKKADKNRFELVEKSQFVTTTIFPEQYTQNHPFEIYGDTIVLRSSAGVLMENLFDTDYWQLPGNEIGRFYEGMKGVILHNETVKGIDWVFVKVDGETVLYDSVFGLGKNSDQMGDYFGWVQLNKLGFEVEKVE